MSTATVRCTHSPSARTLTKTPQKTSCTSPYPPWRAGVERALNSAPNSPSDAKVSDRYNALRSRWTGSESRIILHAAIPRGADQSHVFLARYRGPRDGLIHSRTSCRAGRFNLASKRHVFPFSHKKHSKFLTSISDTRLAYGYYLGPAYGYGGAFGNGSLLVFIVLGFIAVQAVQSLASGGGLTRSREMVSVLKLQVGLLGFARTLQNDLERISDRADTSTSRGLHYVLTETVLALLRQPDMCILGTSMAEVKRSIEAGERRFNQLSLEERGKFDEETLVNVDGNRKRGLEKSGGDGFSNEYIVVTLLVAAEGDYSLPAIYDNNDLKESLKKLGSIPADSIQGVEILWTPQDKADSLTERDLLRNYPLLKSL